jgi:hypothetical protein
MPLDSMLSCKRKSYKCLDDTSNPKASGQNPFRTGERTVLVVKGWKTKHEQKNFG